MAFNIFKSIKKKIRKYGGALLYGAFVGSTQKTMLLMEEAAQKKRWKREQHKRGVAKALKAYKAK